MKELLDEINQIPEAASECLKENKNLKLPKAVPYLGMGSSYFAALTAAGAGTGIWPHLASEYFMYLSGQKLPQGVLISQSGETSEVLWNLERFESVIAITNESMSSLAKASNIKQAVLLKAGEEKSSSTKTFINSLVALYLGLGLDVAPAVADLKKIFSALNEMGEKQAEAVLEYKKKNNAGGLYVLGSGPNYGAACEAALALAEITKLPWQGMELAQYDHGPKEAADNSIVVFLDGGGKDLARQEYLAKKLQRESNAFVFSLSERSLSEPLSPFSLVVQSYFLANRLANLLKVKTTYRLGGKITTVPEGMEMA